MWSGIFVFLFALGVCHGLVEDALVTEKVYLDVEVEGAPPARIIIGLFGATSPKTVRNFVALANHEVLKTYLHAAMQHALMNHEHMLSSNIIFFRKGMAIAVPYFTGSLLIL
jgi:hypothetical protein